MERLNTAGLRARLLLVGGDTSHDAPWLESRPWSLEAERRDLSEFDIGIMPLPDDEWTRGKCGYKLLQYFSAGVPAVASPVGVNKRLVGDDRGFLASTGQEWYAALGHLVADVSTRAEMGTRARDFVANEYSYQHWAPTLGAILRDL